MRVLCSGTIYSEKLEKLSIVFQDGLELMYVDTRRIAVEYRLSHWASVVQKRKDSGLSVREYCEGAGIKENKYYYWLKKLREAAIEGIAANGCGQQPTSLAQPTFAELKLPPRQDPPFQAVEHKSQVCIEAGGVRVTAGSEYPIEKLACLLTAVMRPCF